MATKHTTTGYSGTPLPRKLGIKEGARVALLGDVPDYADELLDPMPDGVEVSRRAQGRKDVIVVFAGSMASLGKTFHKAQKLMEPAAGLWVGYPKKASGVPTDLTFDNVQKLGLDAGLVDNKSCAIDEIWSGLRFVIRLKDR